MRRRIAPARKHTPEWLQMLEAVAVELARAGTWRPDPGWDGRLQRALGTTQGHRGGPADVLRAWAAEAGHLVDADLVVSDPRWTPPPPAAPRAIQRGLFDGDLGA